VDHRYSKIAYLWLCAALLLTSCAAPPTYADVRATASAEGCWPDGFPTPRAITVTPADQGFAAPIVPTPAVGQPSSTPLPSTTAIPRCPPPPGATAVPWPTAVPPPAPYPTIAPRTWAGGSARQTTLHLPSTATAAHPSEGWPAVASVVWSGNRDPDRVLVSVFNPHVNQWSSARQVDLGASGIGRYSRTVAIAITGDRVVHVVWAMSDPDFQDGNPPAGVWTASSADFGQSWSPPARIATDCPRVNDAAATPDGVIAVQLICDAGQQAGVPTMLIRTPDGGWQAPERLPIPVWPYSDGSVVVSDQGASAQIVSVTLAGSSGRPIATLARRPIAGGAWQLQSREVAVGAEIGMRMGSVHGISYDRSAPDGTLQPAISFTWTGMDAPQGVYALTSIDGGASWGQVEPVFFLGLSGSQLPFAAPAYDPAADRLVALFTCCADARWAWVESTHFARWSAPGSGVWPPPGGEAANQLVPLALGSRAAAQTVTAQAPGSRSVWIAWIDTLQRVEVRSVELNQIIPVQEYPTAVPPTIAGGA
jgi:hypothetical protein